MLILVGDDVLGVPFDMGFRTQTCGNDIQGLPLEGKVPSYTRRMRCSCRRRRSEFNVCNSDMGFRTQTRVLCGAMCYIRSACYNKNARRFYLGSTISIHDKNKAPSRCDGALFLWGEIWGSNPRPSGPQPDARANCANPTI